MNQWILLFSLILGLGGTGCENREPGIITIMGEIKGLPEGWVSCTLVLLRIYSWTVVKSGKENIS